jgi:hypothetical protein
MAKPPSNPARDDSSAGKSVAAPASGAADAGAAAAPKLAAGKNSGYPCARTGAKACNASSPGTQDGSTTPAVSRTRWSGAPLSSTRCKQTCVGRRLIISL